MRWKLGHSGMGISLGLPEYTTEYFKLSTFCPISAFCEEGGVLGGGDLDFGGEVDFNLDGVICLAEESLAILEFGRVVLLLG